MIAVHDVEHLNDRTTLCLSRQRVVARCRISRRRIPCRVEHAARGSRLRGVDAVGAVTVDTGFGSVTVRRVVAIGDPAVVVERQRTFVTDQRTGRTRNDSSLRSKAGIVRARCERCRIVSDVIVSIGVSVNLVGRGLGLIIRDVLVPEDDVGVGVNDNVVRTNRFPDQNSPGRNGNAGLGRKIHFLSGGRPVAFAEGDLEVIRGGIVAGNVCRNDRVVDVSGSLTDSLDRIAKRGRKRTIVEARCEVVDNTDDLAVLGKSGLDLTAEDRDAVDLLLEVSIRDVAIRVSIVSRYFEAVDLLVIYADQVLIVTNEFAKDLGALRARRG